MEIVSVHNGTRKAPHLASGVHFIHPLEPCRGIYGDKPFQVACRGGFDNAGALIERAGVTNFHSMQCAEILVHLLKHYERERTLLYAFVDVVADLRGEYAVVLTCGDTLLAAHTKEQPLYLGACLGAILVVSDCESFSTHGAHYRRELPVAEIFCQITNRQPMYATPSRPVHQRIGQVAH